MSKWFDIFKTGTHTDTNGRQHVVNLEDLKTIERKFNEADDDAALTVGHPKDSSPAYGWLQRVRTVGEKMQGLARDVVPEFAEAVRKRMYKKISVSLRPDLTIRHVGFLGGMPPAVKGLDAVPLMFNEEPGEFEIEFAEGDLNFSDQEFALGKMHTLGRMMQNLRDLVVEKFGIEPADKALPQWDLDFLKADPPPDTLPAEVKSFNESITPERGKEDKLEPIKKPEPPVVATPPVDFAEKVTTLEGENSTLRTENQTLKRAKIEGEVANFVEGLKGKLLPKFKKGISEILTNLQEGGLEINFSETEKKPAFETMMSFLEALPHQVPTKEVGGPAGGEDDGTTTDYAEGTVDEERLELHKKALALKKKEKIPYEAAARRVMKGGN